MASQDTERQELERAIELMGRSTRPGRLLEYLGAKYFQQQAGQLTEFTIATEVFGRSAKTFDPTSDAVVRVEEHRLRKKLKEIYERDSRAQGLQFSQIAQATFDGTTQLPEGIGNNIMGTFGVTGPY